MQPISRAAAAGALKVERSQIGIFICVSVHTDTIRSRRLQRQEAGDGATDLGAHHTSVEVRIDS
jgi:hypothetical protein